MEWLSQKAIETVKQAGKIILESEVDQTKIKQKSAANYVTEIDLEVQKYILTELHDLLPDSNIITEESSNNKFSLEKPTWILDPVDGTTNLMRNYKHSAVSLAFFEHQQPVMGIVYNPYKDEMFTAIVGKGAFCNNEFIQISANSELKDCLIAFGTNPYHREEASKTFRITEKVFLKSLEIRRTGSAALDLVDVALGRVEGFYEYYLQPWDYAAGMIILQEAGGQITTWQGEPLPILKPSSVLATNGRIHQEMMGLIEG